jgi:hypothetical protein
MNRTSNYIRLLVLSLVLIWACEDNHSKKKSATKPISVKQQVAEPETEQKQTSKPKKAS